MKVLHSVLLSAMLLGSPAWAKHWHEDQDHWRRHEERRDDDRDRYHHARNCYFEPHDVRVISEYYAPRRRPLPPGLAGKYYRTGHLPPGWETRIEPLPAAVERQLVPVPQGYRRGIIDGVAVVFSPGSGVIVDVTALFGAH